MKTLLPIPSDRKMWQNGGMGMMGGNGMMVGPMGGGMGAIDPSMGAVGGGASGPPAVHERPPSSVKVFVGQIGRY